MNLNLTYHPTKKAPISAAFLSGNNPFQWLQTIGNWGIPLPEIDGYILPKSKKSIEASGLFVIFNFPKSAAKLDLINPYQRIGKNLFIPINSELTPQVRGEEWAQILLHDLQVFHPNIGLIGFAINEKITFYNLLQLTKNQSTNWDYAHAGLPKNPILKRVSMPEPLLDAVFEKLAKDIEKKPLEDLPKGKNEAENESLGEKIGKGILGGIGGLAAGLGSALAGSGGGKLLDGLSNWASQQMANLDAQRNAEINRLLDLFDKNMEEALKFALPINSAYQNRGTAPPSSRLGKRGTDFSMGGLSGGRADFWNLEYKKREALRQKYLQAAQEQIKKGNFRKAAYIYAELLGDIHGAANVLKQGKHYREAAILYRDHLKNKQQAAVCLELGGHYKEALDIYEELGNHLKVGDLYKQLGEPEAAKTAYEKAIQEKLICYHFHEAGNLVLTKLEDTSRAEKIFLDGWKSHSQHEACLKQYFQMNTETEEDLSEKIDFVHQENTPIHLKITFLNILKDLRKRGTDKLVKPQTTEIAYEILSEESQNNDHTNLNMLKFFVEGDEVLLQDVGRFVVDNRGQRKVVPSGEGIRLVKEQHCGIDRIMFSKSVGNEVYGMTLRKGFRDKEICKFFRLNWQLKNEIKQLKFGKHVPIGNHFFVENMTPNKAIIPYKLGNKNIHRINKNTFFPNDIEISMLHWIPQGTIAISLEKDNGFSIIKKNNHDLVLEKYDNQFNLKNSLPILIPRALLSLLPSNDRTIFPTQMYHRNNAFYFFSQQILFEVNEKGATRSHVFPDAIKKIAVTDHFQFLQITVITNNRLVLVHPNFKEIKQIGELFGKHSDNLNNDWPSNPNIVEFIGNKKLAVANWTVVNIFDISSRTTTPKHLKTLHFQSKVAGILKPSHRNQFVILTSDGKLSYYSF